MRRRKFLNVGGLGLLSLHGFSRGMTSLFLGNEKELSGLFLQQLGATPQFDHPDFLSEEWAADVMFPYRKLGYAFNGTDSWHLENYCFLPMKLAAKDQILDEVVFIFSKNTNWQFTGTFQAANMIFLLKNKNQFMDMMPAGRTWADMVLPTHAKRNIINGRSFYPTRIGEMGFAQTVTNNEFRIEGTFLADGMELYHDNLSLPSMQPGQYFEKSLSIL